MILKITALTSGWWVLICSHDPQLKNRLLKVGKKVSGMATMYLYGFLLLYLQQAVVQLTVPQKKTGEIFQMDFPRKTLESEQTANALLVFLSHKLLHLEFYEYAHFCTDFLISNLDYQFKSFVWFLNGLYYVLAGHLFVVSYQQTFRLPWFQFHYKLLWYLLL